MEERMNWMERLSERMLGRTRTNEKMMTEGKLEWEDERMN